MIRSGRLPLWNGSAGCGAPHLANGQSAVFDPFNLLAYLGPTSAGAIGWMAACRLWVAGSGCSCWRGRGGSGAGGAGSPGWFIRSADSWSLWLLYPVTAVAIWMPWLSWRPTGCFASPTARAAGWLAIVVALVVLGRPHPDKCPRAARGWRCTRWRGWSGQPDERSAGARPAVCWALGACLGLGACERADLAAGLLPGEEPGLERAAARDGGRGGRSTGRGCSTWSCTAVPYAYGSQRRGHPNLARALGVHNLNESAGGFAGLAHADLAGAAGRDHARAIVSRRVSGRARGRSVPWAPSGCRRWTTCCAPCRCWTSRITAGSRSGSRSLLALLGGIGLDQLAESRRLARGVDRRVAAGCGRCWRSLAGVDRVVRGAAPRAGARALSRTPRRRPRVPMPGSLPSSAPSARCVRCSHFCRGITGSSPVELAAAGGACLASAAQPGEHVVDSPGGDGARAR